jgi:hypothetical protein
MNNERWGDAIDDRWLEGWLNSGFRQLDRYLAAHGSVSPKSRNGAVEPYDERWSDAIDDQWLESGFNQLDTYLTRHAAFTEWLEENRQEP